MARKKTCHFLVERGTGVNGTGYACPILRAAERGCFDTDGSYDPLDTTCRTCMGSGLWRRAMDTAQRVAEGTGLQELYALREKLKVEILENEPKEKAEAWARSYGAGLMTASRLITERIRVIQRDAPYANGGDRAGAHRIEAWILGRGKGLDAMRRLPGGTEATHRAEMIFKLVGDFESFEVVKSRHVGHGLYRRVR